MRTLVVMIILFAVTFVFAGCVVDTPPMEYKPPQEPVPLKYGKVHQDSEFVTFYDPNTFPEGGTLDKYVILGYENEKYLPINPYRDVEEIPLHKSEYDYKTDVDGYERGEWTGFMRDSEILATDLTSGEKTKKPVRKTGSQKKAAKKK